MDVYGLIGNPVAHSLSPPMHEAAYEALDIDARYVTFEPPAGAGAAAVRSGETLGVAGLNVTIPFKEQVIEAVDLDPLAARIGAVNTIAFDEDGAVGYNTDATGLVRAFEHHDVALTGRAVVVGAGGAGRAAAFGLAEAGMDVAVANRTTERAHSLADEVSSSDLDGSATGHSLSALESVLADATILVNATSVGMEEDLSPVPAAALHEALTVLDAVYTPIDTRLLRDARDVGAQTIDGAWMLLFQGVDAFEIWTDQAAPVDEMNETLRSYLE